MNWLYNKNIILSGASSGIGKDLTLLLINKYHCKVLGLARTENKLAALKDELGENGTYFDYYPMDVSKKENWQDLAKFLIDSRYQPDILINNAGTMTPFAAFDKTEDGEVEKVMATNFFSATYAVKSLLPLLRQSKSPAIINISSAAAISCIPGTAPYSASKVALRSFSEILHCELKGKVFVSTIMPGFAKTNLFYSKDNAKDVINAKDSKLINKISMASNKMAKKIVNAIKHKKARVVIGGDARLIDFLYDIAPQSSGKLVGYIMKKSKLETFHDVYEKEKK